MRTFWLKCNDIPTGITDMVNLEQLEPPQQELATAHSCERPSIPLSLEDAPHCPNYYENPIARLSRPRETSFDCVTERHGQSGAQEMPPAPPRRVVPKDRFAQLFGTLKTQAYHDPAARGTGSHTYETSTCSF
jgi:hypothetical protein